MLWLHLEVHSSSSVYIGCATHLLLWCHSENLCFAFKIQNPVLQSGSVEFERQCGKGEPLRHKPSHSNKQFSNSPGVYVLKKTGTPRWSPCTAERRCKQVIFVKAAAIEDVNHRATQVQRLANLSHFHSEANYLPTLTLSLSLTGLTEVPADKHLMSRSGGFHF